MSVSAVAAGFGRCHCRAPMRHPARRRIRRFRPRPRDGLSSCGSPFAILGQLHRRMSANGTKRTCAGASARSAFDPKQTFALHHTIARRQASRSKLVRARWDLLGNALRLVGGFVVDRLKTGAGHCNYEFAIPDVNHNTVEMRYTVEMRSQGQSFRAGPQITILPVLKESPAKCRAKN